MNFNTGKSRFKITGVDRAGKRFRICTDNAVYARGINVWRGTKWELDDKGNYRVICRIYN